MSSNPQKNDRLNALVAAVDAASPLDNWNSFIETLHVPSEVQPAILTGRPELLAMMQARPLNEQECRVVFDLIGGLIRTNIALRDHAEQLAILTDNWAAAFSQLASTGRDIQAFANFQRIEDARERRAADA